MTLRLITAPAAEPVTLAEWKSHLHGVSEVDTDADLTLKLLAARHYIEKNALAGNGKGFHGRALITSTWELRLACWPREPYIEIPLGNLQAVSGITYTDSGGSNHTFSTDDYKLVRVYTPADSQATPPVVGDGVTDCYIGRVQLNYGKLWPSETLDTGEPIVIGFTCGWDGATNVPAPLKAAVELYATHLFQNRSAVSVGHRAATGTSGPESEPMISTPLAMAIDSLCAPFRDNRF